MLRPHLHMGGCEARAVEFCHTVEEHAAEHTAAGRLVPASKVHALPFPTPLSAHSQDSTQDAPAKFADVP